MKIFSYCISFPDDADVLADALNSMSPFCDRIFLLDGGFEGALCHHPRFTDPLREWIETRREYDYDPLEIYGALESYTWNEVPITIWEHPFRDPAHARNYILDRMAQEPEQPDWIYWHDADEIASWELIRGIRPKLESLSDDVVGVYVKWLTLVQDEQHCVQHMSDWLAHPRIHRPLSAHFQGNWHEHMVIDRNKCVRWDVRVIHTRALYRNRLKIQRGHDSIARGQTPLWADAKMVDIPNGVTWPKLFWPNGESKIPFEETI